MNILQNFPGPEELIRKYEKADHHKVYEVNGHVHTPFSFSAFNDIPSIFQMARRENIKILGINDFFVADGYEQFYKNALSSKIFPLFNIEFIGLLKEEQASNIRVNDPVNPGRCYFSGKGLSYPFHLAAELQTKLDSVIEESQMQVQKMVDKANRWFAETKTGIVLNFETVKKEFARELVRERHIAKAIRVAVFNREPDEKARKELFTILFGGKPPKAEMTDIPGLENEIRGNLLKAGGKAFVEEDDKAFMNIDQVIEIIVAAGGIPCYPVLLDDKNGVYTDYERDRTALLRELQKRHISCIELIPGRNSAEQLNSFVRFFNDKGFVITFGTEHNAPEMIPLTCTARGRKPLDDELKKISFEGACVIAAHQYLKAKGLPGYTDEREISRTPQKEYFVRLGKAVIDNFINL